MSSSSCRTWPATALVVARELEVVALVRHAALDGADTAPGVQPRAEGTEHGQIRVDAGRLQRDEEQASEVVSHGAEGSRASTRYSIT